MQKRTRVLFFILFLILAKVSFTYGQEQTKKILTDEQIAYLEALGPLKAAYIDGIAPLQYRDSKNQSMGISISILNEIADMLDLETEYIVLQNLDELPDIEHHIILSTSPNYLSDGFCISDPYLKSEMLIIYNNKNRPNELRNKKYGHIRGGTLPDGIIEDNVIIFDNRKEALDAVNSGEIDYTYGNAFSLAFYDMQEAYRNISHMPSGEPVREYSFAVKEEYRELIPILNTAIANIDKSRLDTLVLESISKVEKRLNLKSIILDNFFIILVVLSLIIGYIVKTNKKLKRIIEENKKKEAEIRYISYHDGLTDLYNRRYLQEELKRTDKQRKLPISIIVGDLNGLKIINDNFGHYMGDKLLISVGKILNKSCREGDIIARYGGDEFIIILYNTDIEEAEKIAKRIKKNSEEILIEGLTLSISLGCASKSDYNQTMGEIIKEADKKMYENKRKETGLYEKKVKKLIRSKEEKAFAIGKTGSNIQI